MQVALQPVSIGFILALLVVLLAILGLIGVLPMTSTVVFGLIAALGLARLL